MIVFSQLRDLLLSGILFAVSGETSVCCLVKHEVLRLDVNQIAQERCEEKRAHHWYDEWEVEQDLGRDWVSLDDHWKKAGGSCCLESGIWDHHIDIEQGHNHNQDQVNVLQDDKQVEVRMIVDSDAVIYPLTVMVKSLYTLIALITVTRVCSANDFTARTE